MDNLLEYHHDRAQHSSIIGPIVGLIQRYMHRYKSRMLFGAGAQLVPYG